MLSEVADADTPAAGRFRIKSWFRFTGKLAPLSARWRWPAAWPCTCPCHSGEKKTSSLPDLFLSVSYGSIRFSLGFPWF